MQKKEQEHDRSADARGARPERDRSADSPSSMSLKNRVKFLCSYGGRILPRPSEGNFKYAGGDTRVLAVSRSVSFNELKKMIQDMFWTEVVIKYQLAAVELDVLVTVAGDEDLVYMFEEYDRLDALHPNSPSSSSSPRFRLFIFPSSSVAAAAAALDLPSYAIDAGNAKRSVFTVSTSARTSPTSSVDGPAALLGQRKPSPGTGAAGIRMQRVRSTPNLGGGRGSGGSLVSLAYPTGHKGSVSMIQCQHQHVHWQHGQGGAVYRQQPPSAPSGGGSWRTATPAVRYEVCGCRVAVPMPPPSPALRGGHHYAPGHVGCTGFGKEETSAGHPQKCFHTMTPTTNAARVGLPSSPSGAAAPCSGAFPRPQTWDEFKQVVRLS